MIKDIDKLIEKYSQGPEINEVVLKTSPLVKKIQAEIAVLLREKRAGRITPRGEKRLDQLERALIELGVFD